MFTREDGNVKMHQRRARWLRNRRGATIVLVGILMFSLVGFGAFAIDFGRLYLFRAQLQTTADAAAMAGAIELFHQRPENADPTARAYVPANLVERNVAEVGAEDVVPGSFNWADQTFTPLATWTDPGVNAIRVTAFYNESHTLGGIFSPGKRIAASAIAALGTVGSMRCLKPWAVPYENILWALGEDPTNLAYEMTQDDVAELRDHRTEISFKITQGPAQAELTDNPDVTIPGNYYAVTYPALRDSNDVDYPGNPVPGADEYRDLIGGECLDTPIHIGDWLETQTGNMQGPTRQGVGDLCGANGATFDCAPDVPVHMPIWANRLDKDGKTEVQVRYIGSFMLTRMASGYVVGYLTALNAQGGGVVVAPGPVQRPFIVN